MQLIDILIDLFQNEQYKSNEYIIYFIKFESFALQCLHMILQCPEHVDMWSESKQERMKIPSKLLSFVEAQIRLVNYCCTLLYKSVLDNDDQHSRRMEINHLMYAEEHRINHSLSSGILTFLSVVRCRKEIGRFYRENEHFRELLSVMKHKYGLTSEYFSRDPSIAEALNQVVNVMFERHQRKKKRQISTKDYLQNPMEDEENRAYQKCSNSLCQMTENNVRILFISLKCISLYLLLANSIRNLSSLSSIIIL